MNRQDNEQTNAPSIEHHHRCNSKDEDIRRCEKVGVEIITFGNLELVGDEILQSGWAGRLDGTCMHFRAEAEFT